MPPRLGVFTFLRRPDGLCRNNTQSLFPAASSVSSAIRYTHSGVSRTTPKNAIISSTYRRSQPLFTRNASTVVQRKRRQDPYYEAQARARKAANISRQEVLRTERSKALGDPVRGITTPFAESFDTANPPPIPNPSLAAAEDQQLGPRVPPEAFQHNFLNHFVTGEELTAALERSNELASPYINPDRANVDPAVEQAAQERHEKDHATATAALTRILSLENSSAKDRLRTNVQRCIQTFGRHETDKFLQPKPPANNLPQQEENQPVKAEKTPRAGPDTGSSEVQAAILTAKIRSLANFLDTRGKKDKHNKRNLRLLVHRRQKILKYLRKKERGGERWQHLIQTLGLTDGTFQGEISM